MLVFRLTVLVMLVSAYAVSAETRVIDGDTLEVDGEIYRLNGIDAPEHGQKCGAWTCGADATEALADLVEDEKVICDPLTRDGYGRTVATCFVGNVDLGGTLVDKGVAWAFRKYSDAYVAQEDAARAARVGIWSGRFQPPWAFREQRWQSASEGPNGCRIKGNISRNGKIYHAPWSPWYGRTKVNEAKGERWFCDEAEAVAAGWRAPYWH